MLYSREGLSPLISRLYSRYYLTGLAVDDTVSLTTSVNIKPWMSVRDKTYRNSSAAYLQILPKSVDLSEGR